VELLARDEGLESHAAPQGEGEPGEGHQRGQEASHEVERPEQVAHPLVGERHHQVEGEEAIAKRIGDDQERRVAGDGVAPFQPLGGRSAAHLAAVRRHVVAHEAPRQPREGQIDQSVPHEEEPRGEPRADVGALLHEPGKDGQPANEHPEVEQERDGQERGGGLGEPDDQPRPVALGELLGRREHDETLGEPRPEQEVDVPRLPGARRGGARKGLEERHGAERGQHGTPGRDEPHRESARRGDERRARPRGRRDAHRGPPRAAARGAPAERASACSVRT